MTRNMKAPILRKGRTKSLLESSIDCALLAVEIYNKPCPHLESKHSLHI